MAAKDLINTYKGWPKWARIAAPISAGVIAISAVDAAADDGPSSAPPTTTTTIGAEFVSIEDATEIALGTTRSAGLSAEVTATLVRAACRAAEDPDGGADELAGRIADAGVPGTNLRDVITALGDAAEAYCPDAAAAAPDLLNSTYSAGVALLVPATTTTEATTTTAPPTTAPPTTVPPTTSPPTTLPPTTAPPPPPPPSDGVYYANCDAARAAGAAPIYRGEPGYRSGLDRDNDGVACE